MSVKRKQETVSLEEMACVSQTVGSWGKWRDGAAEFLQLQYSKGEVVL